MDSSTLLLHLLSTGHEVTCLSFDYGQKHKVELERATDLVEYLNKNNLIKTNKPVWDERFPLVKHQIIKLDGLAQLLNSSLVEGGAEVPEGHYAEENMKDTVVPNRNKIFSSIIQAVALSISNKKEAECVIALGVHSGDHSIYPDCTEAFRNADEYAFKIGNWDSELVNYYTPYMEGNKFTILEDGVKCCDELGLDFDEVYKRTNTSYKPIYIAGVDGNDNSTVGKWYSDYKSASSVERVEAFMRLGRPDPCEYADENGPVVWQTVVSYVSSVLENHGKETSNN
jgi:7-cyano-7-deazaguanine synthase